MNSYVTRANVNRSEAGSASKARIRRAAGAPPCWAFGSQGPRASSVAVKRPSGPETNTGWAMATTYLGQPGRAVEPGSTLIAMATNGQTPRDESTFAVKAGLAEMLKGGVIMDVVTPEQAKIAEDAGAAAVMALERVPADIRRDGGVARMSDPEMIQGIQEAVTIPVMAKARIGHFAEAQVLEALEVDYVDESEVLTPADEANHIDKWAFKVPFVCGATNLGEALRRIGEGAAMIRSKGEAGTGDIVEAVRHLRLIRSEIRRLGTLDENELATAAKELQAPLHLVRRVAVDGRLPVVLFCAGGIATPADASLVMQLGAEGVFVGSGIFKSDDPAPRARAIVEATTHFADPARVAAASTGLGQPMVSLETSKLDSEQLLASRGW
jgi:pyridoxal 5'-phosphate synthase pdxS subunit